MEIRTVGVLGCGLMGSGIAQVCAASGYKTVVREVDDTFLQKGLGRIRKFLDEGVAKGKVTPPARDKTLGNLSGTTKFEALTTNCVMPGNSAPISRNIVAKVGTTSHSMTVTAATATHIRMIGYISAPITLRRVSRV